MAARTRKTRHDDETRRRIKAAQLICRLESCALGSLELSKEQIKCCDILLKKVLPDLQAVHTTEASTEISQAEWVRKMIQLDPEIDAS